MSSECTSTSPTWYPQGVTCPFQVEDFPGGVQGQPPLAGFQGCPLTFSLTAPQGSARKKPTSERLPVPQTGSHYNLFARDIQM
jgi:hypothetical protein